MYVEQRRTFDSSVRENTSEPRSAKLVIQLTLAEPMVCRRGIRDPFSTGLYLWLEG